MSADKSERVVKLDSVKLDNITALVRIDDECMETQPCSHEIFVKIRDRNETIQMWSNGDDICRLCELLKIPIPEHFQEYKNWSDSEFLPY